jgi:predicted dehydrogenase
VKAQAAADPGRARGDEPLRIALVGCGGRGTGAAAQALKTEGPTELVAMADAFEDRLASSYASLREAHGERVQVPAENRYVGFDAYRRAIDSGADVVILATPPGFRPEHFSYAVERDKHVFQEKPLAVDAPGIRRVLEAGRTADRKGLKVGVGLQRHHDPSYVGAVRRIRDGAIGEVLLMRVYWNSAGVWVKKRQPEMSEMQYQMRNWYYFNWLCGDHIVEQHIHNLDVGNWVKGAYPVAAQGQGGRQWRTGLDHGEIYDHHFVEYTWADGSTMLSQCRHTPGCWDQVAEFAHGTAGSADLHRGVLRAERGGWKYEGEAVDPYQAEHDHLFAAIRQGAEHSETHNGAMSTMTAILGRMATYSGKRITWDDALASDLSLEPTALGWDETPPSVPDELGRYPVAVPGVTRVV